jgi:hypothetical protein
MDIEPEVIDTELPADGGEHVAPEPTPEEMASEKEQKLQKQAAYHQRVAERERKAREAQEARIAALEASLAPKPTAPKEAPTAPTEESCDYDSTKYQAAQAKYVADLVAHNLAKQAAAREEQERTQKQQQTARERQEAFARKTDEVQAAGEAKYEDFDSVVRAIRMPAAVAEAVCATEAPEDVAYYLGKNPEEAERISTLGPLNMAVALGRIDAKIKATPKRTVSNAPPPPGKHRQSSNTPLNPSKLTAKEYMQARNEGRI